MVAPRNHLRTGAHLLLAAVVLVLAFISLRAFTRRSLPPEPEPQTPVTVGYDSVLQLQGLKTITAVIRRPITVRITNGRSSEVPVVVVNSRGHPTVVLDKDNRTGLFLNAGGQARHLDYRRGSWQVGQPLPTRIDSMVSDSKGLLYGTTTPPAILKSTDGGQTWETLFRRDIGELELRWLFVRPGLPARVYALTFGDTRPVRMLMYRSDDGGRTWLAVSDFETLEATYEPVRDQLLIWGISRAVPQTQGPSVMLGPSGLLTSTDGGISWAHLDFGTLTGQRLVPLGAYSGKLYVGGGPGDRHLFATEDGGQSWDDLVFPEGYDATSAFVDPANGVLGIAGANGIAISTDAGRTWIQALSGRTYLDLFRPLTQQPPFKEVRVGFAQLDPGGTGLLFYLYDSSLNFRLYALPMKTGEG